MVDEQRMLACAVLASLEKQVMMVTVYNVIGLQDIIDGCIINKTSRIMYYIEAGVFAHCSKR